MSTFCSPNRYFYEIINCCLLDFQKHSQFDSQIFMTVFDPEILHHCIFKDS